MIKYTYSLRMQLQAQYGCGFGVGDEHILCNQLLPITGPPTPYWWWLNGWKLDFVAWGLILSFKLEKGGLQLFIQSVLFRGVAVWTAVLTATPLNSNLNHLTCKELFRCDTVCTLFRQCHVRTAVLTGYVPNSILSIILPTAEVI